MKKLLFGLIIVAIFSCNKKKDDPAPVSKYNNPYMEFSLDGSNVSRTVTVNFTLKDTNQLSVIKTWSKTVTYSGSDIIVNLDLPGLPEAGYYHQSCTVCYSSSCHIPMYGEWVDKIIVFRINGNDQVNSVAWLSIN